MRRHHAVSGSQMRERGDRYRFLSDVRMRRSGERVGAIELEQLFFEEPDLQHGRVETLQPHDVDRRRLRRRCQLCARSHRFF